jgi:hypothetical protein
LSPHNQKDEKLCRTSVNSWNANLSCGLGANRFHGNSHSQFQQTTNADLAFAKWQLVVS